MDAEATVFVVDDDPALRRSLQRLLELKGRKVETYASASEFLESYDIARPGCLLLDVRLPGISGIELHEMLADRGDALPVIIMTGHGDVPMAVRAMQRGAVDFIEKPFPPDLLMKRIAEAFARDSDNRWIRECQEGLVERLKALTPREREVMHLVVEGNPNKKIAAILGLSRKTVEIHRARMMQKSGASSLPDLVRMVLASEALADWNPSPPTDQAARPNG